MMTSLRQFVGSRSVTAVRAKRIPKKCGQGAGGVANERADAEAEESDGGEVEPAADGGAQDTGLCEGCSGVGVGE